MNKNVLVLGSTGCGASTLLNYLIGEEIFETSNEINACTKDISSYTYNGINFYNVPGLNWTDYKKELENIVKILRECHNMEYLDAIIYCVHSFKMDKQEKDTFEFYKKTYNKFFENKNIIIIRTHLDTVEKIEEKYKHLREIFGNDKYLYGALNSICMKSEYIDKEMEKHCENVKNEIFEYIRKTESIKTGDLKVILPYELENERLTLVMMTRTNLKCNDNLLKLYENSSFAKDYETEIKELIDKNKNLNERKSFLDREKFELCEVNELTNYLFSTRELKKHLTDIDEFKKYLPDVIEVRKYLFAHDELKKYLFSNE